MNPDVVIRPVADADIASIHAIYTREVLEGVATYEYDVPDAAEMRRRVRAIVDLRYPYLVAESGGTVLGYAYASGFRARAGYRWTVENTVYVAARARGRGIGRTLLDALIIECTALGFRQMVAVIGDATNAASIALHRYAGFVEAGRFPGIGYKHGRWLENVQMIRPLGAGCDRPPG